MLERLGAAMPFKLNAKWQDNLDAPIHAMLEALGTDILSDMQDDAPVKTGKLRDSLTSTVEDKTLIVSAGAKHAPSVELGDKDNPAQPFMRPAVYKNRELG